MYFRILEWYYDDYDLPFFFSMENLYGYHRPQGVHGGYVEVSALVAAYPLKTLVIHFGAVSMSGLRVQSLTRSRPCQR